MKTFEDVVKKAVSIADADPKAIVAVFDLRSSMKLANCMPTWVGEGTYKRVSSEYISASGGKVRFIGVEHGVEQIMGSVFTHVFCSEYADETAKKYIQSRIRYVEAPYPEPAGFYDFNGVVTRTEVWK